MLDLGLDLLAPVSDTAVRTPGLHASDLYGSFYKKFDPKRYDKGGPLDATKMFLGMGFERLLELVLAAHGYIGERPGEFTSPEGVIFSPDYLFDIDGELILGEFKLTWYSSKDAPDNEKFAKWLTQIKLYLHWLELWKVWLIALFVNNNYPRDPSPVLLAWELTFTTRELKDEYNLIMRHAREEGLI